MHFNRPNLARFSKKQKFLAGGVAVLLLGVSSVSGSILFYDHVVVVNLPLPKIKPHGDIPFQPLTTYADSLNQQLPDDIHALPANCQQQNGDWIKNENLNAGISFTPSDWRSLQLYHESGSVLWLDRQSVTCGDRIKIHASLYPNSANGAIDKTVRTLEVLRVGWYGGAGARMMWNSGPVKLKYRNTPNLRNATRMIETRWPTTTSFTIGEDWAPGLYFAASLNKSGAIENIAPFILRSSSSTSKLLLVHSTLTWSAYNSFGGHSTYSTSNSKLDARSKVASLDRPYAGSGMNHIERDAIAFVQYLESTGLNIDQLSDIDLSNSPSLVNQYGGMIFSGHPEYMTRNEFDTVSAARNLGINIAFMGANSAYWQTRTEPSPAGPDRHMVIYRNALLDPQTDWQKVSIGFANRRINTPPSLLTGEKTAGVHVTGTMTAMSIPKWLRIPVGATLAQWSPNSEIDSIASGDAAPKNVHLLFSGKFSLTDPEAPRAATGRSLTAQTIWFTAPSGSATFVAGINYWPCEISPTCSESHVSEATRALLQSVTSQVLTLWQNKYVGKGF